MTEEEKLTHARKLNLARRHLNSAQKRMAIRSVLMSRPEMSNIRIAKAVGVSDHTVADVRHELESTSQIAKLEKTIGADGKERTTSPNKTVSVYNPSVRDAEALKDPDIQRRLAENDGMNVASAIREQNARIKNAWSNS